MPTRFSFHEQGAVSPAPRTGTEAAASGHTGRVSLASDDVNHQLRHAPKGATPRRLKRSRLRRGLLCRTTSSFGAAVAMPVGEGDHATGADRRRSGQAFVAEAPARRSQPAGVNGAVRRLRPVTRDLGGTHPAAPPPVEARLLLALLVFDAAQPCWHHRCPRSASRTTPCAPASVRSGRALGVPDTTSAHLRRKTTANAPVASYYSPRSAPQVVTPRLANAFNAGHRVCSRRSPGVVPVSRLRLSGPNASRRCPDQSWSATAAAGSTGCIRRVSSR